MPSLVNPRFDFTDPPFRHSPLIALAVAARNQPAHRGADRPMVLTGE